MPVSNFLSGGGVISVEISPAGISRIRRVCIMLLGRVNRAAGTEYTTGCLLARLAAVMSTMCCFRLPRK